MEAEWNSSAAFLLQTFQIVMMNDDDYNFLCGALFLFFALYACLSSLWKEILICFGRLFDNDNYDDCISILKVL